MRVAVFGAGSVGGYFGGQLAMAGLDVIFIARGAHLDAIRANGLVVESAKGNFTVAPAQAEQDPAAVGPVDVVLLGVKAGQVSEAAQAMRPLIGPETIVIPLQNGVEASDELAAVLGSQHVTGGLCRVSCILTAPGHIVHAAMEPTIAFNWFDGHADARLQAVQAAFTSRQVNAEIPADINAALWRKFAFIAAISGVGAVARAPVGVIRSVPATRAMLEAAIAEVAAVGRARGVSLSASTEQDTLNTILGAAPATTASMQRDIIAGKPSELEYQNGSVVRLGHAAGVPTPVHSFLYASLLPLELRARGQLEF